MRVYLCLLLSGLTCNWLYAFTYAYNLAGSLSRRVLLQGDPPRLKSGQYALECILVNYEKTTKILLNLHNSCRNPFQNYMRTSQKPVLFLWGERGFSRSISLCKGKPFGILIVSSDDFGNAENNSSNLWKISFTKMLAIIFTYFGSRKRK